MGEEFWQVTAQMFSSLFEKPKMTEKLLLKPPFKYLFDIVTQTTKSTGFAKGLYSEEELSGDFYDTKEKKIYYLKKIITLTGAILKEEVEAKPNKIVAGVEPDKTNLFLQAMYRAAVSGEDSTPFVKKILSKFAQEEAEFRGGAANPEVEETKQEAPRKKKEEPKEEPRQKEPERKKEKPKEPQQEEPKAQDRNKEPERPQPQGKQARPGTASRGGPPRDKSNVQVVDDTKTGSGPSGIIRDDQNKKKDEDENLFETKPQDAGRGISNIDAEGHGQFVKKALKDVQDAEQDKEEQPQKGGIRLQKRGKAGATKTSDKTDGGLSKPSVADSTAGTSQNEVEMIQKLIQNLTQNINPLRKSIDFINDDIESMNKEMEHWRSQYLNSKGKYQLELANTEEQLQPLQNKLAELEEQIKDKKFKIQAAKSHILQNEQKIQKLLYSVVSNK